MISVGSYTISLTAVLSSGLQYTDTGTLNVVSGGITGTLAATESGTDTFFGLQLPTITGDLSAVEIGTDTFTGSGAGVIYGTLAASEIGTDVFAGSGSVATLGDIVGDLLGVEADADSFVADGVVTQPVTGGVVTLSPETIQALATAIADKIWTYTR